MGDDRSLDEFFGQSESENAGGDPSEELRDDDADETESANDAGAEQVTPAVATFRWSPTGATCDSCSETVQRRWHDEETGEFVCIDCKPW
ncbi:DUF7573 domain-containing protein [Haloprofundus salilacus]|uniref:DUF7573 domain-containing protein n=1 Tax=Haloprofundus salilacus TaxID=2876190 RepID=UPI001CCD000F|nr:hypothetical protein [Haloprofundus salilacus]